MQCDSCKKSRRIDRATYFLYHTDTWFRESKAARRIELLAAVPALRVHLELLLRELREVREIPATAQLQLTEHDENALARNLAA